jgi:hypothetical protein
VCVGCSEQCNCGALCNIVVKPMRVCRRGKSVACGTPCAEGASLRGTACGTCKELSSNMVAEVSALDPLRNVCSVCSVRQRVHGLAGLLPCSGWASDRDGDAVRARFFAPRTYSTTRR